MKRFFTLITVLFVLGTFTYAEKEEETQQQETQTRWWGYVEADNECYGLGTNTAETYHCAAFYPGDNIAVVGKTIHAVRFQLLSSNVRNVKVWIAKSLPSNFTTGTIQTVNVTDPTVGINEVELTTPYKIDSKGIYVGYSFTVTKLQSQADNYPVAVVDGEMKDALILKTSSSVTSWSDLYGQDFGRLYLQIQIEGVFPYTNAVAVASSNIGEYPATIGGTAKIWLPVTNAGTNPLESIDYTITSDGITETEQHFDFDSPLNFGATQTIALQVSGDDVAGSKTKTINITNANGVANELNEANAQYTILTLPKLVHHGIAVEEFTGTQCGWCPRGMVGMEKLRTRYGDHFVGIAVHGYANSTSQDAMFLSSYSTKYAKIFSGAAPSCQLNRAYGEIDPYYGTGNDICDIFEDELSIPAMVGIDLTGEWNEDSTKVTATATIEALTPGKTYTIEYALIADSLTGTGTAWNQSNYYVNYSSSELPKDLAMFGIGGKYGQSSIKGWTFNDVVIATCYKSSKNQTTALGELTMGEPVTNTYTLTMPTSAALKKAITKEHVAVVCLIIAEDGTVANAAKFYMPGYYPDETLGIRLVQHDNAAGQRFSVEGHKLQGAKKGLNIIRMADGTTRKVFVR